MISEKHGQYLVEIAKKAILTCLNEDIKMEVPKDCPKELMEKMGIFVTLNKKNALRGCIGYPEPIKSAVEATIESSISAAFSDPRFPELTIDEYPDISIELTVLTEPELLEVSKPEQYLEEIELGRDGIIIQKGYRRGLLLPQVAIEHNMTVREFLEHTCMKAGISADSWMDASSEVYTFQGKIFR